MESTVKPTTETPVQNQPIETRWFGAFVFGILAGVVATLMLAIFSRYIGETYSYLRVFIGLCVGEAMRRVAKREKSIFWGCMGSLVTFLGILLLDFLILIPELPTDISSFSTLLPSTCIILLHTFNV